MRRVFVAVAAGCWAAVLPVSSASPGTTVAADRLGSIFLTPEEVDPVMGTASMQISVPIYPGPYTKNLETMAQDHARRQTVPASAPIGSERGR